MATRVLSSLPRYAFLFVWFVLVPIGVAWALISWLNPADGIPTSLPAIFVTEQPVPAFILLFTAAEMLLYRFRSHLPLASHVGVNGRPDLHAEVREDYETGSQLLEEAERLIASNRSSLKSKLGKERLTAIDAQVTTFRTCLAASPFQEEPFYDAFEGIQELVEDILAPWRKSELREYTESIVIAVGITLLLRAVVIEAFKIPSGSMLPTLQIGDHIFGNKFIYGPTIPFTETRALSQMPPTRGDVVVFEFPYEAFAGENFIKRVIAIPGDVLKTDGGHPIINGWRVPSCLAKRVKTGLGPFAEEEELYVEYIGELAYLATYQTDRRGGDKKAPIVVKPGEVLVMGDNRHNSNDSRVWGGVPLDNIKGRAMFVWFPFSRLFTGVMGVPAIPPNTPDSVRLGIEACLAKRPPLSRTTPPTHAP